MTDQVNEAVADRLLAFAAEMRHHADTDEGASRTHRLILQWAHGLETVAAMHSAHPSRGVVDEAMVRRALDAFGWLPQSVHPTCEQEAKMRAALQAAALPAVPSVPDDAARIMGRMLETNCVTMQAAWIEWQHGKGAEAAMSWIHNTLWGPGLIPDENEPYAKEAQAWFDANRPDAFPACPCGRPSNILWMGKGFCCNAHYQDAKAATPAHDQPEGEG